MADFDIAYDLTILKEGRYSDSRYDLGGKTKFGITEKVARKNGYQGDMKDLTIEFAKRIYREDFWNKMKLDLVEPQMIANEIFDTGVNCGIRRAIRWAQENLNALNRMEKSWDDLKEDGVMGMITLGTLNAVVRLQGVEIRILKMLNADQTVHYKNLSRKKKSQEMNLNGWLDHRVQMPA